VQAFSLAPCAVARHWRIRTLMTAPYTAAFEPEHDRDEFSPCISIHWPGWKHHESTSA